MSNPPLDPQQQLRDTLSKLLDPVAPKEQATQSAFDIAQQVGQAARVSAEQQAQQDAITQRDQTLAAIVSGQPTPPPRTHTTFRDVIRGIDYGFASAQGPAQGAAYLKDYLDQVAPMPSDSPSSFERGPSKVGEFIGETGGFLKQAITHPVETVYDLVSAPFKWAYTTATYKGISPGLAGLASLSTRINDPDVKEQVTQARDFADAQRGLIALTASTMIGGAVSGGFAKGIESGSILEDLARSELPAAARPVAISAGRKLIAGTTAAEAATTAAKLEGRHELAGAFAGAAAFPIFERGQVTKDDIPHILALTAIGMGIGLAFKMAGAARSAGLPIEEPPDITNTAKRAVYTDLMRRALPSVNDEPPTPTTHIDPLLFIQGQAAADKVKALITSDMNMKSALIYHGDRLGTYGSTVISGIDMETEFGEMVHTGRGLPIVNTDLNFFISERPDGLADVLLIGKDSPWNNTEAYNEFRATGFLPNQEVYYRGTPVVYKGNVMSELVGDREMDMVDIVNQNGDKLRVPIDEITRPSYTEVGAPVSITIVKQKVTPEMATEILNLEKFTPQEIENVQTILHDMVDISTRMALGLEKEPYSVRPELAVPESEPLYGKSDLPLRPAIKLYDDRTFVGATHGDALDAANEVIPGFSTNAKYSDFRSGFLDSAGRFISRDRAIDIAKKLQPEALSIERGEPFLGGEDLGLKAKGFQRGEVFPVSRVSKLKPGINTIPFNDALSESFGLITPEPTTTQMFAPEQPTMFVYADKKGNPIGIMEVVYEYDPTAGTYRQILKGEEPRDKITTSIRTFAIDPTFSKMEAGRAAITLMEKANELGVTKLVREFSYIDDGGANLAAHYINKYRGGVPVKRVTAHVGEATLDLDAVWHDFKAFSDDIDNVVERYGKDLPDINDLRKKYPVAVDRALMYPNADDGMFWFSQELADKFESGEIPIEIAESDGTRMSQYLEKRSQLELYSSFDAKVRDFAHNRGFTDQEFTGLYRYLANKAGEELRQRYMTPDEYSKYNEMTAKLEKESRGTIGEFASAHGYTIDISPTGGFVIKDAKTSDVLAYTESPEGVRQFITSAGAPDGVSLDGGGKSNSVPPSAIGGGAMPPSGGEPPKVNRSWDELALPYQPREGIMDKIMNTYRLAATHLVKMESVFTAMDSKWGLSTYETVFNPLQRARLLMDAARHPYLEQLKKIENTVRGLDVETRQKIGIALETMTPQEIMDHGIYRKMNEIEINNAKMIAGMEVDMWRVFTYLRNESDIGERVPKSKQAEAFQDLERTMGLTADEQTVAALFTTIKNHPRDEIDLGAVVRLADAIQRDTPGRQEYMGKNGFTPDMRDAVDKLDKYYDQMGKVFGINFKQIIRGYMPHYRSFADAPSLKASWLFQKGLDKAPEARFISEMARTNEISSYERDPILAALRYTTSGFNARMFAPVYESTVKAASDALEILRSADPKSQRYARNILEYYLGAIRGRPDAAVDFTQAAVSRLIDELGIDASISVRRDLVDTFTALQYASLIGLRARPTVRDVFQYLALSYSKFGAARTARAMHFFGTEAAGALPLLRAQGVFPGLGPSQFMSAEELNASAFGQYARGASNWVKKMADFGMTWNGQKSIFEMVHASWYLQGREEALSVLNGLDKNIREGVNPYKARNAAYRELGLELEKPAFIKMFDNLVRQGKIEDAAHVLGQQRGRDIAFLYGYANHPMGWGTNVGKLIGIFGTWPTWMQDYVMDMLSRGTKGQRAAFIGRFAITQAAVKIAAAATGYDMFAWYLVPGMMFTGGPLISIAQTLIGATQDPSEAMRSMYRKRLTYMFPWNNIQQFYIPFSGGVSDLYHATNDPEINDIADFFARTAGIKVQTRPHSLLEVLGVR